MKSISYQSILVNGKRIGIYMARWNFVTNYGAVLVVIAKHGRIKALDIALELGLTERTVRRIIADLLAEGYIHKTREGSINRYEVDPNLPLRRLTMRDVRVQDLIQIFSSCTRNSSI